MRTITIEPKVLDQSRSSVTTIDLRIDKKEFEILKNELNEFNPELLQKDFIIAISKTDLLDQELMDAIEKELPENIPHIFISSAISKNLMELKDLLWQTLNKPVNA